MGFVGIAVSLVFVIWAVSFPFLWLGYKIYVQYRRWRGGADPGAYRASEISRDPLQPLTGSGETEQIASVEEQLAEERRAYLAESILDARRRHENSLDAYVGMHVHGTNNLSWDEQKKRYQLTVWPPRSHVADLRAFDDLWAEHSFLKSLPTGSLVWRRDIQVGYAKGIKIIAGEFLREAIAEPWEFSRYPWHPIALDHSKPTPPGQKEWQVECEPPF